VSDVKIAHIATTDVSLRYLLLNQLLTIKEAGYDVYGISSAGTNVPEVRAAGIEYLEAPLTRSIAPLTDLVTVFRLYRVLKKERFTIVHTHTPKAGLLGQYAAALAGVPIRVHTIHGLYFPGHMKKHLRWAYVLLERITMLPSHFNLSQNPEDVPVAIRDKISRADRIACIGNGIDVRVFDAKHYTRERREEIRRSLGLSPEHKVVGMVARLVDEKGYPEMLEAARILKAKCPEARFVFIGAIEKFKKDSLDPSALEELGLADVAQFLGHRNDIRDLYAVMDVLAHPSHREGFPRAPMEAASMGVPCVVSDERGCRQTVDDGVNGYLVPLRDHHALAARLLELLTDDEKRRGFGEAGRKKAEAEFDERLVFDRIVRTYERLLDEERS
jgi:glycosyltransferase involved in cell wall biosynthesis